MKNTACGTFNISGTIDDDSSITSSYFALENTKTHMSLGIAGSSCQSGAKIELQQTEFGAPNQQFMLQENRLVSLMCPQYAVTHLGSCQAPTDLQLGIGRNNVRKVKIQLKSIQCLHMREVQVIDYNDINVALNKPASQSSNYSSTHVAGNAVDGDLITHSHTSCQDKGKHQ